MGLACVASRAAVGIEAPPVMVEVHLAGGLPGFSVVGLPETAVRESKDRVRAALANCGFKVPRRRITVSLAPADLPKEGGRFDLPIALGIIAASRQLPLAALQGIECLGELGLSGELRPVSGALPAIIAAREHGHRLILPDDNAAEAALVPDADCVLASSLDQVCAALRGALTLPGAQPIPGGTSPAQADLADVRGQHRARRALEIAAAGGHNLLLIGPPGTGKTMLASRLPGILPPLDDDEALQAAAVASVAGQRLDTRLWKTRRFRNPHHTASAAALVGGGSRPRPGEISLAHAGVLFLDELPEFSRHVLEVLREPLESGRICISRALMQAEFPARFQLIAAMNPCPCGYLGDPADTCQCTPDQVLRYRGRVSGPLLDRIDLHVEVPRQKLRDQPEGETSRTVGRRVAAARARQQQRCGTINAHLGVRELAQHCTLAGSEENLLDTACERLNLSARAQHRILRVARTIADLDDSAGISKQHLAEAIGYRILDRRLTACA